jgi:tRNA modification GTPase
MDTIFALATATGRAGIAVVRISGPLARDAAERFVGTLPEHGRTLRTLRDGEGAVVDHALVLTFDQGRSFTGECVVELHLHGSLAVIHAVLRLLGNVPGLRHAEAGEFTRRAMDNGRLDLAQVEGLADLIDAETEAQRRQAMRVLSGALGRKAEGWRASLIRAAALIEATIDFADEDVPVDVTPEVAELLLGVRAELRDEAIGVGIAERIRDGFEVAIVGAPNVGKSTLLNYLAGRDAAITSVHAGTTRDVIEVRLDLDGLPVTVLDTAGLRAASDEVEQIGIARARERAARADIRIHLLGPGDIPQIPVVQGDVVVAAKADLTGEGVSGVSGQGVDRLVMQLASELRGRAARVGFAMRERHRIAMERSILNIDEAIRLLPQAQGFADLIAEELRRGISAIDSLVGRVDVEDILDEIFASFCIGK